MAAVVLDDLAADGQAEAGTAGCVGERVAGCLTKRFEHPGLVLGCDADSRVGNGDLDRAADRMGRES